MRSYFIDESNARNYILVAVQLENSQLRSVRRVMNDLRLPGQSRIHFVKERDSRRRQILSALRAAEIRALVFESRIANQVRARERCLSALVTRALDERIELLVLERDDSSVDSDRRVLFRETRDFGTEQLSYRFEPARSEPALWAADAIAWSTAKRGTWQSLVAPLISELIVVD